MLQEVDASRPAARFPPYQGGIEGGVDLASGRRPPLTPMSTNVACVPSNSSLLRRGTPKAFCNSAQGWRLAPTLGPGGQKSFYPEGVAPLHLHPGLTDHQQGAPQPLRGRRGVWFRQPRVAAPRQPWAMSRNAFGVGMDGTGDTAPVR